MNERRMTYRDGCWSISVKWFDYTLELLLKSDGTRERRVWDEGTLYWVWANNELSAREQDGSLDLSPRDLKETQAQNLFGVTVLKQFTAMRNYWDAVCLLVSPVWE